MPRDLRIGDGGVAAELGVNNPRLAKPTVVRSERKPPPDQDDDETVLRRTMAVKPLPGRKGRPTGRIRWYHRVKDRNCWAFTIPKSSHEAFEQGLPLSSAGATFPDGRPVVPEGEDPANVAVRCGSCGSHTVDFLQLVFFAE